MSHDGSTVWNGRFFDDFKAGDVFQSRIGRTITESDNILFTCLTMNTNQIHFNKVFAESTQFGEILVNSTLTLAIVTGLTVPDTSENGGINLEWTDIKLPNPVFIGDTIWAESEILDLRQSRSNESQGIITMRCRGINQDHKIVCEFRRTFMLPTREDPSGATRFPVSDSPWTV